MKNMKREYIRNSIKEEIQILKIMLKLISFVVVVVFE
jgi:hypothetical protein